MELNDGQLHRDHKMSDHDDYYPGRSKPGTGIPVRIFTPAGTNPFKETLQEDFSEYTAEICVKIREDTDPDKAAVFLIRLATQLLEPHGECSGARGLFCHDFTGVRP